MTAWSDMEPEQFGQDGDGMLFDASCVAKAADKTGTPDMFAQGDGQ